MRAGGVAVMLLAVGACATPPPTEEFRSFTRASDDVARTTLTLLGSFETASFANRQKSEERRRPPDSFDPTLVDPRAKGANTSLQARRDAVEAIRIYNATMLFLAEGGSHEAVRGQVDSFVGLISGFFPGASVVGNWAGPLAEELEKARSAREFRIALKKVTIRCGDEADAANTPGVGASAETVVAPNTSPEDLKKPEELAACMPVIEGIYEIFKKDTRAFYARQFGVALQEKGKLADAYRDQVKTILALADKFKKPAPGEIYDRIIVMEDKIAEIGKLFDQNGEKLGLDTADTVFNDAAVTTLEQMVLLMQPIQERHEQIEDALLRYADELTKYVRLISRAQDFLDAVEEADNTRPDYVSRAVRIGRLGLELQRDAIGSRDAFERLTVILLGTART